MLCSISWKSTSLTESTWSPSCSPALCASESGITCEEKSRDSSSDSPHGQCSSSPASQPRQPSPRASPRCPSSTLRRDWGRMGSGDCSAPATLCGLGRDQEMAQDCLIAAWCLANYSYVFGDAYKAYDNLPAHPAGSATPKGTDRTRGGNGRRTDTP